MEISTKNTKTEILDAYEAVLKELQESKSNVPKQVQEEKQKTEIVNKVSDISQEGIIKGISNLKFSITNSLDKLETNLIGEFKNLEEIRSAIGVEKQYLEDLYSLSANTDSLAAMLLVQKETKVNFEQKMAETETVFNEKMKTERALFASEIAVMAEQRNIEKQKQAAEEKEYSEELKKQRRREADDYDYHLKITRKKEEDAYEANKAEQEKLLTERKSTFALEVAKRQEVLKSAEAELNELRKINAEFPTKLDVSLANKEKDISEKLKTQFDFEQKLNLKQNEGELKLKNQIIVSLQEKIVEMQTRIKDLDDKANIAELSVKDIAVKAIENSSKVQVFQKREKDEN